LLVSQFYKQALLSFPIDSCYTDWLVRNFRKIQKTDLLVSSFHTSYLTKHPLYDIEKEEFLYRLFQLLNYLQEFKELVAVRDDENQIKTLIVFDKTYRLVSFPVTHFVEYTGKEGIISYF